MTAAEDDEDDEEAAAAVVFAVPGVVADNDDKRVAEAGSSRACSAGVEVPAFEGVAPPWITFKMSPVMRSWSPFAHFVSPPSVSYASEGDVALPVLVLDLGVDCDCGPLWFDPANDPPEFSLSDRPARFGSLSDGLPPPPLLDPEPPAPVEAAAAVLGGCWEASGEVEEEPDDDGGGEDLTGRLSLIGCLEGFLGGSTALILPPTSKKET